MVGTYLSLLVSQKNSARLMVGSFICNSLNYYLVKGFNYKEYELLTTEIMMVGDILELEGEDS
ncbi:MAG: hypothetical protein ACE5J2_07950 [Nitrososphaerales archaeon]